MTRERRAGSLRSDALLIFLAFAVSACDPLPGDAPVRLARGIEAAQRQDHGEAYWWWRPLADAGMAEAQYHLGWLYANGDGLRVDVPAAIEWWQRAARNGYTDAEFAIGMAYLNGENRTLKKDLGRALEWLARAGTNGNHDAREIVEELVRGDTAQVITLRPRLLEQPWLGTQIRVTAVAAKIFHEPSRQAKVAAEVPEGASLRRIDERAGWLLVVLPDDSGVGWIAAGDAGPAATP